VLGISDEVPRNIMVGMGGSARTVSSGGPGSTSLGASEVMAILARMNLRGPTVDKVLAMAYVRSGFGWPGSRLVVSINGRPCLATVVSTPFSTRRASG
jgi:hypothetical protein